MYIPGRLRTASSPSSIVRCLAEYVFSANSVPVITRFNHIIGVGKDSINGTQASVTADTRSAKLAVIGIFCPPRVV